MIHRRSHPSYQPGRLAGGVLALAAMAGVALAAPAARACGYHDPQVIARGILNWTYPESLHVGTAVWMAEDAGVLPPRPAEKVRDMFAYQKMVSYLQTLGARLRLPKDGDNAPVSFAAVLLDSMLWIRFVPGPEGYAAKIHADGPEEGDVVVVTHGKVIKALAKGNLDAPKAERHGLIRLYRNDAQHDALRRSLAAPPRAKSSAKKSMG